MRRSIVPPLAFIQRGELIAYGSPQQIKADMMKGQVLEIATDNAARTVMILRESDFPFHEVSMYGSLVHVTAKNIEDLREPIQDLLGGGGLVVENMAVIDPSLEDVFIAQYAMKWYVTNGEP